MNVPIFDQFKLTIEGLIGKNLTDPAVEAARDFYDHWDSFVELISQRQLSVHVDPLFLAHNYPQYRHYHIWKGAGLILAVIGLVVVWLFWQVGFPLIIAGVVLHWIGNRVRYNDAKQFAEELMKDATANPADGGFAKLCINYIAALIKIATPLHTAHWPQHPSNAVTGRRTFIETKGA